MRHLIIAALIVILSAQIGSAARIVVFAASSLKGAMDEISVLWAGATGDEAVIAYGGSGAMAQQIIQGAPADVFISANPDWMDVLDAQGLLADGSRIDLVGNRLVLIGPPGAAGLRIGPDILARLGDGRLAVGQTRSVPAGIYARAALEHFGLWEALAPRLIETETVAAAVRLVAFGDAPLGIAYLSDATGTDAIHVLQTFPANSHPPIIYPAAIMSGAPPQAADFLAFLQGSEAQDIFRQHGFLGLSE